MMILAAMVASSLAASTSPAPPADGWQFARWGMNASELRTASHGRVRKASDGDYDMLAGGYSMGKFRFAVNFDYTGPADDPATTDPTKRGLEAVMLNLDTKSGTCVQLEAYLKTKYGKPTQILTSAPAGARWSTKALGDIDYSTFDGKKCSVMYEAFGTANK